MIKEAHTIFYSSRAAGLRAFLRDKIGFNANDVGDDRLLFRLTSVVMVVHPSDAARGEHTSHGTYHTTG